MVVETKIKMEMQWQKYQINKETKQNETKQKTQQNKKFNGITTRITKTW